MVAGPRFAGELPTRQAPALRVVSAIACVLAAHPGPLPAQECFDRIPYRAHPIAYFEETSNPVAQLQKQVDDGVESGLFPETVRLSQLLEALRISPSSQLLVFARNARQSGQISPATPRAIYFNDEVSVAWTPGGKNLEISAIDPVRGPVFYLAPVSAPSVPEQGVVTDDEKGNLSQTVFRRTESCLACHVTDQTRHVPGYLLRSMFTAPDGKPESGLPLVDHTTPYDQRWGGWYVSGEQLPPRHRGNLTTRARRESFDRNESAVVVGQDELLQATSRHLQQTSDIVALLVHDHQTRFQTLLTRLRYEQAFGRPLDTLPDFVRTMLLWDEPALPTPVAGRPDYQRWFESAGPEEFRPLRRLDLKTRLLRNPLSWLVATPQFQTMPEELRQAIQAEAIRLVTIGRESPTPITDDDRQRLLDELLPKYNAAAQSVDR